MLDLYNEVGRIQQIGPPWAVIDVIAEVLGVTGDELRDQIVSEFKTPIEMVAEGTLDAGYSAVAVGLAIGLALGKDRDFNPDDHVGEASLGGLPPELAAILSGLPTLPGDDDPTLN